MNHDREIKAEIKSIKPDEYIFTDYVKIYSSGFIICQV